LAHSRIAVVAKLIPCLTLIVCSAGLSAQVAALPSPPPAITPPQLSPKAAYDQAMHPLEQTRHSISNWSDSEVAAMMVSIGNATRECAARDVTTFAGEDLIDVARLCALGQNWPAVIQAANLYIKAPASIAPGKPKLTQAYAALVDAQLRAKDGPGAVASAKAMLAAVPYDAVAADAVDEVLDYTRFLDTGDAVAVAALRQPALLQRLGSMQQAANASTVPAPGVAAPGVATPGVAAPATATAATTPAQTAHDLYADGIAYAALQQLAGYPAADVATTVDLLEAALPQALAPDEAILIAVLRKRYALLGKPLPEISATQFLGTAGTEPQLPMGHAVNALLLFPDWCAQCIRMGAKLPVGKFVVDGHDAYLYALLAPTQPQTPKPSSPPLANAAPAPFNPADATNRMRGTPTLVVPKRLLDQFAATDVPYLILTDAAGIVRVLQPVSDDAILPGDTIDSAIARVAAQWPAAKSADAAPGSGLAAGNP
jgi:hypothetical protein